MTSEHVLVVDDNPIVRSVLAELLRGAGYDVLRAEDGMAALETFASGPIDLVLLDVEMPGLDGLAVCERLRALPGGPEVPIVLVTSHDDPRTLERLVASAADDFLRKPVDATELLLRTRSLLALRRERLERRKAEQALVRRESLFKQVAENVDILLILRKPASYEAHYLSPAFEKLWGRPRSDLASGKVHFLDTVHPEDRERVKAGVEKEQAELEYRVLLPSGGHRWVRSRSFPILDEGGRVTRMAGVLEDVTARRSAGESLQRTLGEAERLRASLAAESEILNALIQSSRIGILLVSLRGAVQVVNPPFLHLSAVPGSPETWMGRAYTDLAAAMPRDLAVALGALDAEDEDGGGDLDLPRASVQWRSFAVSAGDRVVGRVVSLSDVSEERQLARLRDDITHMMVHDLRGPLTSIHGILALLQESPEIGLPQRASAAVDAAVRATEKLRGLVTGILDVSRLESGALPVNRQPVDALAVVHEVLALEAASAVRRGVQLVAETGVPSWEVEADADLLRRVLQNLVGNALKFTPSGGKVTVALEQRDGRVLVSVRDTGSGVPQDLRPRLFQKFSAGTATGRGSGLGLAFCRLAVEAHGGKIWHEEHEDAAAPGSVFRFHL